MLFFFSVFQFIVQENLLLLFFLLFFFYLFTFEKNFLKPSEASWGRAEKNQVHFPTYQCSLPPTLSPHPQPNSTMDNPQLKQGQHMLELSQWTSSPTLGHQTHSFLLLWKWSLPADKIRRSRTVFETVTLLSNVIEIGQPVKKWWWWKRGWRGDRWQTAQL